MPKTPTTTRAATPATVPHLMRAVFVGAGPQEIRTHVMASCCEAPLRGIDGAVIEQQGAEVHVTGRPFDVARIVGLLAGWNVLVRVDPI